MCHHMGSTELFIRVFMMHRTPFLSKPGAIDTFLSVFELFVFSPVPSSCQSNFFSCLQINIMYPAPCAEQYPTLLLMQSNILPCCLSKKISYSAPNVDQYPILHIVQRNIILFLVQSSILSQSQCRAISCPASSAEQYPILLLMQSNVLSCFWCRVISYPAPKAKQYPFLLQMWSNILSCSWSKAISYSCSQFLVESNPDLNQISRLLLVSTISRQYNSTFNLNFNKYRSLHESIF